MDLQSSLYDLPNTNLLGHLLSQQFKRATGPLGNFVILSISYYEDTSSTIVMVIRQCICVVIIITIPPTLVHETKSYNRAENMIDKFNPLEDLGLRTSGFAIT